MRAARLSASPRSARFAALLALAAPAFSACGGEAPVTKAATTPPRVCGNALPTVTGAAITLADTCGDTVSLLPVVRISGAWRGGGVDGACTVSGGQLSCPAGDAGEAQVTAPTGDGKALTPSFRAAKAVKVEAIGLAGTAHIGGATGWLSNGFQSWSQSGVLAIQPPPSDTAMTAALVARGDTEVLRGGSELSWTWTFVGGPAADGSSGPSLVGGATSAARWKPWASVTRGTGTELAVRFVGGGTGEEVAAKAGEELAGEGWHLELGDGLPAMEERYAQALTSRAVTTPRPVQAGWNSWYELWDGVDEKAVRADATLAKAALAKVMPAGQLPRIVVDDGWQMAWGDWTPNAKFPSGLDGLHKDLANQGFSMGVWLAPLLAAPDSAVAKAHPTWFVGGAIYHHPIHGDLQVLDVTQPDAAAHLTDVVKTIVGWGLGVLKIDFLFAGTYEGTRAVPMTGMEAYAKALGILRAAAGEETLLVAVGAPPLVTIEHVDGWRVGADIAYQSSGPNWAFLPNQARSVASRGPFCRVTRCDADPALLRALPQEEVTTGVWIAGLAGGAMFYSDDLRSLPADRTGWGFDAQQAALALGGLPSVPEDAYPAAPPLLLSSVVTDLIGQATTQVVPARWKTPAGARLGLNVTEEAMTIDGVSVPPHAVRALP